MTGFALVVACSLSKLIASSKEGVLSLKVSTGERVSLISLDEGDETGTGRGDGGSGGYLKEASDSRPGEAGRFWLRFDVAEGAGDLERPRSAVFFGAGDASRGATISGTVLLMSEGFN